MSKYNVGDIVKLRDDLEDNKDYGYINTGMISQIKSEPFLITEVLDDKYKNRMGWIANDEMIEGLWEECKEKQDKLKLIDVLNMITKGELKEGTKVKYKNIEWEYKTFGNKGEKDLVDKANFTLFEQFYMDALSDEVELIEPPCIGADKTIEPTDNTKIEELDKEEMLCLTLQCAIAVLTDKLNEVINKVNIHSTVLLAQKKEIEDIKEQLDY